MDENILTLLEELSLRTSSCYEDDDYTKDQGNNYLSSNYTSSSNVSSPSYDQLANNIADEDLELKNAVNSLLQELNPSQTNGNPQSETIDHRSVGYDKSKLLVSLLGNVDLVTCAVKKINRLVSMGKRMEQIYRSYYIDSSIVLDLDEIGQLTTAFTDLYDSESYVREVNVSRVYQAYCKKLIDIHHTRSNQLYSDDKMMS